MVGIFAFVSFVLAQTPAELVTSTFGQQPADFLFLVDTSQAVLPDSKKLLEPIAQAIQQLPDNDRVGVIAYHTRTTEVIPPQVVTASVRADILTRLGKTELPSANESDLGAAIYNLTGLMERDQVARLVYLIVVTDFCHSPSVQSPYDGGGRGCRNIRGSETLVKEWRRATNGRLMQVIYLPVGKPQSPSELQAILGTGETAPDAAAWLKSFGENFLVRRYGPVAQDLADKAVVATRIAEDTRTIHFELAPPLTGILENPTVEGGSAASSPLTLAPMADLPVEVTVPPPGFAVLPSTETLDLQLKVTANLHFTPEAAWTALGIDPNRGPQNWTLVLPVTRPIGDPTRAALLATVLVAGLGGAGWIARQRLLRRPLGGSFSWRRGMEPRQTLPLAGQERANIVILPDGSLGLGSNEQAVLILWRTGPKTAFVEIKRDDVEINTRKVGRGKHAIVPGATSFQLGDYRLSWE